MSQELDLVTAELEDAKAGALEIVLEAAQDRAEAERLRALLADARKVSEAAHYLYGDPGCMPDGDGGETCPEYYADDGESPSGVEVCSHLEHRYATWADRCARERLEDGVRGLLGSLKSGNMSVAGAVEEVEGILSNTSYELTMEVSDASGGGKSAWSPAMFREAAEKLRVERDHWDKRTEMVRRALNRATVAENVLALVERRGFSPEAARERISAEEPTGDDYGLSAAVAGLPDERRSQVEQAVAHLVADAESASFAAGLAAGVGSEVSA